MKNQTLCALLLTTVAIAQDIDKKSHTLYLKQENHLLRNYYSPAPVIGKVLEIFEIDKPGEASLKFKVYSDLKKAYEFVSDNGSVLPYGKAIEGIRICSITLKNCLIFNPIKQ